MKNATPPYHILLAEDSEADVALVKMALKNRTPDFNLTVVYDGAEAISFIETIDRDARNPGLDLLLLDMHLPKHNGEEILRYLRSTERCAQTPVVVMTSSDAETDREHAQRHAALHYFRKPSELTAFLRLGDIVRDTLTGVRSAAVDRGAGE
jgi:CheY-like chemotaxis protein